MGDILDYEHHDVELREVGKDDDLKLVNGREFTPEFFNNLFEEHDEEKRNRKDEYDLQSLNPYDYSGNESFSIADLRDGDTRIIRIGQEERVLLQSSDDEDFVMASPDYHHCAGIGCKMVTKDGKNLYYNGHVTAESKEEGQFQRFLKDLQHISEGLDLDSIQLVSSIGNDAKEGKIVPEDDRFWEDSFYESFPKDKDGWMNSLKEVLGDDVGMDVILPKVISSNGKDPLMRDIYVSKKR